MMSRQERITRETIRCASGIRTSSGAQPFLGPIPSNPAVRTVRVINGGVPVFRYYDGKGAEVVNLPAEIPRIRRIEIVLLAESADADPRTGESRRTAFSKASRRGITAFNSERGKEKMRIRKEGGFALIAAVMANLILLSVGIVPLTFRRRTCGSA